MLKKFINDPKKVVDEMLEGFLYAHSNIVRKLSTSRVIVRKDAPIKGKVGLVTGGGSGHKPAFIGYVGEGLMDAVAVGEIFSSSCNEPIEKALEKARQSAQKGMESTKDLISKRGRSSRLGERTKGHIDPGAASSYFILETVIETCKGSEKEFKLINP